MSKHTPGPWTTDKRSDEVWSGDTFVCRPAATRDGIGGMQLSECRANARLIAAAPDLLALAVAILDRDIGNGDLIRMARETIRKAGQTAPDSAPAR